LIHFLRAPSLRRALFVSLFAALAVSCTVDVVDPVQFFEDGGSGADAPGNRTSGSVCDDDLECSSGFCAQGVCCDSRCDGLCLACNVPTNIGACVPLAAGTKPINGRCATDTVASCGHDGTCDGAGACRRYPDGSICQPGRCAGSTVMGAKVCQAGACKDGPNIVCAPFTCDIGSGNCFTSCRSKADCDGRDCMNGSCGKKPLGATCTTTAECDSGFCADGVCCNLACDGACLSCSQPGKMGECRPVDEGTTDPHGICKQDPQEKCGSSGLCNGQGGCAKYAVNTVCKPGSCSGGSMIPASTCNGEGTCVLGSAISCFPYVCGDDACKPSCLSNADCAAGNSCAQPGPMGSCGKKGLGQKCLVADDCKSNFCVDGVCCDQGCTGSCVSCNQPNAPGRCTPVPAGVLDPRRVCVNQGAGSCGTDGKCNGARACETYPTNTVCRPGSCDPTTNRVTGDGVCRNGACASPAATTCAPYKCNGARCGSSCATNAQCSGANVCLNGSCGKRPPGAVCAKPTDCASGFCAQGVCCGTACTASCFSCNLPGNAGTCLPVATGGVDPAGACKDQSAPTCGNDGTCNGKGACKKYPPATVCIPAKCSVGTGTYTSEGTCDGLGKCNAGSMRSCAPFVCNTGGTACFASCSADTQCMPPLKCQMGQCGLKDNGATCGDPTECKSGHCVDGFCCNNVCGGVCQSCALTGARGTCSPIPDDVPDDGGGCVAQAESTCGNDGKCNGAGACRQWGTTVQCRGPSCPQPGATLTKAATCDGHGSCPAGQMQSCGSYKCDTNDMCRTTCASDADCNGKACDVATGSCGKSLLGDQCSNDSDCGSGHCVDKTCCSTAGCLTCQTCANSAGVCADVPAGMPDPDSCSDSMDPCGTTGKCDGAHHCKRADPGTECGQMCNQAMDGVVVKTCDGNGMCVGGGQTNSCHGFLCVADSCATSCDNIIGCAFGKVCVNNTCEDPPPDGGM
jgi:hypothetical protein